MSEAETVGSQSRKNVGYTRRLSLPVADLGTVGVRILGSYGVMRN